MVCASGQPPVVCEVVFNPKAGGSDARCGFLLVALLALATLQGGSAQAGEAVTVPGSGPPNDVTAYVKRRMGCNHWTGEDAYDAQRGEEIAAAVKKLACDTLDADEKRLRRRHRQSPEVQKTLDAAGETDG